MFVKGRVKYLRKHLPSLLEQMLSQVFDERSDLRKPMASSGLPAANKARKTKQAKEAEGVPPFLPVTERKGVH